MLQRAGYILFIAGFAVFVASFFLGTFRITGKAIKESTSESKSELIIADARLPNSTFRSGFAIAEEVGAALRSINSQTIEEFTLSDSELQAIISGQEKVFVLEKALNTLQTTQNSGFKQQALQDFGGWLDGREYNEKTQMLSDLQLVRSNIEKYRILSEKGFDTYEIKSIKYSIARNSLQGPVAEYPLMMMVSTYGLCILGALLIFLPRINSIKPGIRNNGIFFSKMKARGWLGIGTGVFLIIFYIFLYFYPEYMVSWIVMVDPISHVLSGSQAGQFFLYGFLYTLAVLVMGVRMMINYRHSAYQILRTISVMFFQLGFAFLIPEILVRLNKPYFDFKNIWPLDYDFFFDNNLETLLSSGGLGLFMLGWGIALIILGVPVFTYFFGKRWYCSWVCGCGGLAETLGDPYRQLSDKSLKAWKVERYLIHSVLGFAILMTAAVLYTYWSGNAEMLGFSSYSIRETYGAWIGAGFAGVVGTGFYPLMGNRVWCRFGCPLAAYLGLVQRFKSRFRITTNGGQCISCGNCSTYCEMGIDVRWYAQRGQNIVRSSCVGCGICSAVCPRGVLNLETGPESGRFGLPVIEHTNKPS